MYTDSKPFVWSNGKKVDVVCTKMQKVLEQETEINFMPILSCLVKNSELKNESALTRIQEMRGDVFLHDQFRLIISIFLNTLTLTDLIVNTQRLQFFCITARQKKIE